MTRLREALADAKAQVLDQIRELQAAQRDVEKAEYDREAKVGALARHVVLLCGLLLLVELWLDVITHEVCGCPAEIATYFPADGRGQGGG